MRTNPLMAYQNANREAMSGREIEGAALTRAALKLRRCKEAWHREDGQYQLNDALKYNQMIWSIFQSELVDADHPMPESLRRDLLSLGAFVDRRILEIMAFPEPEKLSILIDINQHLAAGLRGENL